MIFVSKKSLNIPFSERILGHFGDNQSRKIFFNISEKVSGNYRAELLIEFADKRANLIALNNDENSSDTFVWDILKNQIFRSGLAYIQVKIITDNGEIWHSPKAAVEFLNSIDENDVDFDFSPSVIEQIENKINEIYQIIEDLKNINLKKYITRDEARTLITESINDLILPLDNRLDGIIQN